jgi:branched-chain amino acid transport system ATP-binding protein
MQRKRLAVSGIEGGYGNVQVLWGVDLRVNDGESIVLLGPNGAGKTTLLKILIGRLPAWAGTVEFDGDEITRLRTDLRVRRGIACMSELGVFRGLTVEENILIGGQFVDAAVRRQKTEQLYELFPDLVAKRKTLAGSLSGGQRKMAGIAKALVGDPKLLIMDEPSSGLSPALVAEVIDILRRVKGGGLSLLVAEQNIEFLDLADRVYTLENGRTGFEGTVDQLRDDDVLGRTYFGLVG